MIKIEIISVTANKVVAAFYYPVPDAVYSSNSIDPNRAASGSGLTAEELQDLRDGKLYEIIREGDPKGKTTTQVQAHLETLWNDFKNAAKNEYVSSFSYTGSVYRDGVWS